MHTPESSEEPVRPPTTILGILSHLGPGLIIAGSIVGSGELIATTKTGAEAGFSLLWLILLGCVIKVFVQVELGRYSMVNGRTSLDAMNDVPGPRVSGRGNWLVWYWLLMFLASVAQLGGIVGGVGQALAISAPLTRVGRLHNAYLDAQTELPVMEAVVERTRRRDAESPDVATSEAALTEARQRLTQAKQAWSEGLTAEQVRRYEEDGVSPTADAVIWAAIIAVITSFILYRGQYSLIQSFSTVMVAAFTVITIGNLVMLQGNPVWSVSWSNLASGFRGLPTPDPGSDLKPIATALAAFGIIGVGASELVAYPYWCLEKGYAKHAGKRQGSADWADRARGWLRVLRWDAWCSMFVYTFATLAFYLLGAAILNRAGLNPASDQMVRTLAVMYEPVFQSFAATLFLFGAFAVLYSTFFVANAGNARVFSDGLRVLGLAKEGEEENRRRVRWLSAGFPLLCAVIYYVYPKPTLLVLLSGVMQGVMLPMLAGAALYFRYYRCDSRLAPSRFWDVWLWLSALGVLITGLWTVYVKTVDIQKAVGEWLGW